MTTVTRRWLARASFALMLAPSRCCSPRPGGGAWWRLLAFRLALSAVYGIDIAIRSVLAPRHVLSQVAVSSR
jgi:hypothetical protein